MPRMVYGVATLEFGSEKRNPPTSAGANPYAAELGAKETAASRLNLAQSFNGLGCIR